MRLLNLLITGLLAGAVIFSIGMIFHVVSPLLAPSLRDVYDDNPGLFRKWHGWTKTYMLCHPFLYGILFAFGFRVFHAMKKEALCFGVKEGAMYGALVFALGSLPVFLLNYASFRVPSVVIFFWIIQNLLQYLGTGAVLGWVTDKFIRTSTKL